MACFCSTFSQRKWRPQASTCFPVDQFLKNLPAGRQQQGLTIQTIPSEICNEAEKDPSTMNCLSWRRRSVEKVDDGVLWKLKLCLRAIRHRIHEMEGGIGIRSPAVEEWLDAVRVAVYDAEDVVDEIATERQRLRIESQSQTNVRNIDAQSISSRMQSILVELDSLLEHSEVLRGVAKFRDKRLPSTLVSTTGGARVFGRDKNKEEILQLLLPRGDEDHPKNVISIVGMGGMGKTALANLVYNDPRVKQQFHVRAWVPVSQEFDPLRVMKSILEQIKSPDLSCPDPDYPDLLAIGLKESVNGKRFLIVLDDVWNGDFRSWGVVCGPLHAGAAGSKIVLTTRSTATRALLSPMGAAHNHYLDALSFEDGWSMFKNLVFADGKHPHPGLEAIGRKIVRKCQGLPLAIKAMAQQHDQWDDVLMTEIWDLPLPHINELLSSLMLSYLRLPWDVRRCFAYCAIFPKDYLFEEEKLVLLWMAEGLVKPEPGGKRRMEHVGRSHFKELLCNSFFQQTTVNGKSYFTMHPLINDLARLVSGKLSRRLDDDDIVNGKKVGQEGVVSADIRHLSCSPTYLTFESVFEAKHLRTLLSYQQYNSAKCRLSCSDVHNLVVRLKHLRALSFKGYAITDLPDSIGELKHLRYLDLSDTMIRELPESVCDLYNLQTLILSGCKSLFNLPSKMENLVNLQHLDTSGSSVQEMPRGISKLKDLRISLH